MIPGIQTVAFSQFPQMLGHFEERAIALLASAYCDDLSGVISRPHTGSHPVVAAD